MTSFLYDTVADIEPLRFGGCLMDLLTRLDLPLPTIQGSTMKKLHKDGCWGVKVIQPGKERGKNPEEDIAIHIVSDSKEKALSISLQQLIGRLCGRHHEALQGHCGGLFGRRDEEGIPMELTFEERTSTKRRRTQYQDLECHIHDLEKGTFLEMLKNDELCALIKEKEEMIKQQEEAMKLQEIKFQDQEKKFANQEKRVINKNKRIRELKQQIDGDEVQTEGLCKIINDVRASKRDLAKQLEAAMKSSLVEELQSEKEGLQEQLEATTKKLQDEIKNLQEKLEATTKEMELYKTTLEQEGYSFEDEEEEGVEDV